MPEHVVSGFECGHQYLNVFLRDQALDETQRDISRTYLLLERSAGTFVLAGYFTLHADSIYRERSVGAGTYLFPLVYLSALARDVRYKRQGVGDVLLFEAFRCVVEAANVVGVAGIHLDTTREGRSLYEEHGFGEHPEGGNRLLISIADVRAIVTEANSEATYVNA